MIILGYILLSGIVFCLLIYLIIALLNPEIFP